MKIHASVLTLEVGDVLPLSAAAQTIVGAAHGTVILIEADGPKHTIVTQQCGERVMSRRHPNSDTVTIEVTEDSNADAIKTPRVGRIKSNRSHTP